MRKRSGKTRSSNSALVRSRDSSSALARVCGLALARRLSESAGPESEFREREAGGRRGGRKRKRAKRRGFEVFFGRGKKKFVEKREKGEKQGEKEGQAESVAIRVLGRVCRPRLRVLREQEKEGRAKEGRRGRTKGPLARFLSPSTLSSLPSLSLSLSLSSLSSSSYQSDPSLLPPTLPANPYYNMALCTTKPLMLSPQESDPCRLPSRTEEERAGPRKVVPEKDSVEYRRRERLALVSQGLEAASRDPSPTPSASSSPGDSRDLDSSMNGSNASSSRFSASISSSSIRTPSPPSNAAESNATTSSCFSPSSSPSPSSSYEENAGPSVVVMMLQDRYAGMSKDLWKKDADAEVCDGEECEVKFGVFTSRRHHCRKCGYVFCSACSSTTYPLTFPTPSSGTTTSLLSLSSSASSILPSSNSSPTTPLSPLPTSLVEPPANHSLVLSRVCLPCHTLLTSPYQPPPVRPSNSRRPSRTPTLAPTPHRTPSHSRSPSPHSTTRFGPPLTTSSASSSLCLRTPTSPYEPWMDGPLKEFPLAWPRQERRVYGPGVQVLKRDRSQRREGSMGEVAPWRGPVDEQVEAEEAATEEQYGSREEGEGELCLSSRYLCRVWSKSWNEKNEASVTDSFFSPTVLFFPSGTPRFNPRGDNEFEEVAPASYGVTWSTF
ncbi:hypothetical protein BDY24DRAFT_136344 [Mrakia frigida]|uniref:FYVE zinc finger domain-containing protein n=1 Tax=Mrakia frigida TaxID=29902 RepID=UPI003FCBF35F